MAGDLVKRVETFFDEYASASFAGDGRAVSGAYSSTYIEAAPSGVEAFAIDEAYGRAVEAKSKAMRRMGLTWAAVSVAAVTPIAPNHILVDTTWRLRFDRKAREPAEATFRITYIARDQDDRLRILLALSHEDEEQALKELGLA